MSQEMKIDVVALIKNLRIKFQSSENFQRLAHSEKCEILRDTLIEMYDVKAIDFIKEKLPKLFELLK